MKLLKSIARHEGEHGDFADLRNIDDELKFRTKKMYKLIKKLKRKKLIVKLKGEDTIYYKTI